MSKGNTYVEQNTVRRQSKKSQKKKLRTHESTD